MNQKNEDEKKYIKINPLAFYAFYNNFGGIINLEMLREIENINDAPKKEDS